MFFNSLTCVNFSCLPLCDDFVNLTVKQRDIVNLYQVRSFFCLLCEFSRVNTFLEKLFPYTAYISIILTKDIREISWISHGVMHSLFPLIL